MRYLSWLWPRRTRRPAFNVAWQAIIKTDKLAVILNIDKGRLVQEIIFSRVWTYSSCISWCVCNIANETE